MIRSYVSIALAFGLLACGDDQGPPTSSAYPYEENTATVIGDQGLEGQTINAGADGCVMTTAGDCIDLDRECGNNAAADVVVDGDGTIRSVICYPTSNADIAVVGEAQTQNFVASNNTVVVIDGADDGVDIAGNLELEGNNVVVYGDGPDVSIIDGDLIIDKNNVAVRGVTIKGHVTIALNTASLLYCVIEGDLIIHQNDATIAACEVHGDIIINQNNVVLVSNTFAETDVSVATLAGAQNLECHDNVWMNPESGEAGAEINCVQ